MNSRVLNVGILAGILISLASLYPAFSLVAPTFVTDLPRLIENDLWHGFGLMGSAIIAVLVIVNFGWLAARVGYACSWKEGAKQGGLAGLLAGTTIFVTVVSPLTALYAYSQIADYRPSVDLLYPPPFVVDRYIFVMVTRPNDLLISTLILMAVIGAIGGVLSGWQNSSRPIPVKNTLLQFIQTNNHPRRWLPEDKDSVFFGVTVGLIVGVILTFLQIFNIFSSLANWVRDVPALRNSIGGLSVPFLEDSTGDNIISPIVMLILMSFGLVVVYLVRQPTRRWSTRIASTVLAANFITVPIILISVRYVYLLLGILPYILNIIMLDQSTLDLELARQAPEFSQAEFTTYLGQTQSFLRDSMVQTHLFSIIAFALPWFILGSSLIQISLLGFLQGVIYTPLIARLFPTPIDQAVKIRQALHKTPHDILPILYKLFDQNPRAYDVLVHLAVETYDQSPNISMLVASFHLLGTSTKADEHSTAVSEIRRILSLHPEWQWSKDVVAIYKVLNEVIEARSLEQMLAIPPISEHTTASLPTSVVHGVQQMNQIMHVLHKVEKVDNLQTQTIFLENALKVIHRARLLAEEEVRDKVDTVPAPEHNALLTTLTRWQQTLLDLIQHLKGRADITCQLKNEQSPLAAQVPLIYEIANRGLNVAQQVRLRIIEGEQFHLAKNGHSDVFIEILPPGEVREVSIPIVPQKEARRIRVQCEISYDDAVDAHRKLEFADLLEFVRGDKPFERIFPIPYVTGTPLKSDDVFVGREDVFSFIRENLLGTKQNNVIILHGQRRTGKTSVLYRLGRVMADTHYGVLIDMQGKPARGAADFLYSIADDIVYTLEENGIEADLPGRKEFEEAPEFCFRNRFLRSLYPLLGEKNLLLLFDEFEELQQRIDDGRLSPDIFTFLRNLMQHESKVDFVFSGTHKLEQLGAGYWSVLFNIAVYKQITFLSPAEIRRLITEPIAQYSLEYDPLAIKRIADVTAGHPYFTQLVLHEAIVYYNETERCYLTVTDIDQILERIIERGEAHFKYIWAESSEKEQIILRGLTERLVGAETVHIRDLQAYMFSRGCGCEEWDEQWQEALLSLESRDILTSRTVKSPLYRFKVDLIRLWIDRTRPAL